MILLLKIILSYVSYKRINIIFNQKDFKLTNNNIFNNFFLLAGPEVHCFPAGGNKIHFMTR